MDMNYEIVKVQGREILDSRGNPTVEAEVWLEGGAVGRASVPSGASTGAFEAAELRDGGGRYMGKGVKKAAEHVGNELAEAVMFESVLNQRRIDGLLLEAEGSSNKERMGANAVLAVSMACARAAANALGIPLYRHLGGVFGSRLPVPMMNILNGGKHADNTVDLQEFMIMPSGAECFSENLRMCAEIYHTLKGLLKRDGLWDRRGRRGRLCPQSEQFRGGAGNTWSGPSGRRAMSRGTDVKIAIDAAASELYDKQTGLYEFPGESAMSGRRICRTAEEMAEYLERLADRFPICSIEDGLAEEDWDGWQLLTKRLGSRIQLVGDDLFVTNSKRLAKGIGLHAGNAILIKMNQIGTLTETMEAVALAKQAGYKTIISHRSGETEDSFIADLAVAVNAGQIKTGAPCRAERTAKYNRLLRIEEGIGKTEK